MIKYGIPNLTFWCVGAALLQIDLWEYIPRSGGYIGPFLRIDRGFLTVGKKLL